MSRPNFDFRTERLFQLPPETFAPPENDDYFALSDGVGRDSANGRADVIKAQTLLAHAGTFDMDRVEGPTGWYGKPLELGLRQYQKQRGLNVDGFMLPGGETITALQQDFGRDFAAHAAPTPAQVDEHHERRARGEPGLLQTDRNSAQPFGTVKASGRAVPGATFDGFGGNADDGNKTPPGVQLAAGGSAAAGAAAADAASGNAAADVVEQTVTRLLGPRARLIYGVGELLTDMPERAREAYHQQFMHDALADGIGSAFDQPLERRESANTKKSANIMIKQCKEVLKNEIEPLGFNFEHFAGGSHGGDGVNELSETAVWRQQIGKAGDGGRGHNFPDLFYVDNQYKLYVGFNIATESGPGKYITREVGSFVSLVKNMGEWVAKITGKKRDSESDEDYARRVKEVCREGFYEAVKNQLAANEAAKQQQPGPSDQP